MQCTCAMQSEIINYPRLCICDFPKNLLNSSKNARTLRISEDFSKNRYVAVSMIQNPGFVLSHCELIQFNAEIDDLMYCNLYQRYNII